MEDTDGNPIQLHKHQVEGIRAANAGDNYVLTTGTGSGKSLSYIIPIVDHVLRHGSGKGIRAIIVYPMNALANSQIGELEKFLCRGYPSGKQPVTFRRYTGQEKDEERKQIIAEPPDILLTNYVMLELVLTRPWDSQLIKAARNLRFLVLDELHTYRGRQGADVSMLVRRVREACHATDLIHIGTSATLAGGTTWSDQQTEVADMSSKMFGSTVKPERVIGETLRRVTPLKEIDDPEFIKDLRKRLEVGSAPYNITTTSLNTDPLFSWIESTFGIKEQEETGRLVRCMPLPLSGEYGAAESLSSLTGVDREVCEEAIQNALLVGYRHHIENNQPIFAFRLHQFISKGESVYASPEPENKRHITLQVQQYVPGSERERVLLPLAFCRECGQEYYIVRRSRKEEGRFFFIPRELSDRVDNDDGETGFLYISDTEPWPDDPNEHMEKLPDAWLELKDSRRVVRKSQRRYLPLKLFISSGGVEDEGQQKAWWLPTPFRFCLHCGVAYDAHQQSDFGKLATLGSEGRSTATTVMSLSTVNKLRTDKELDKEARKLLSFTDNRQDASLQAGHFNDFVEITLLRSALWRAVDSAVEDGLRHDNLTLHVFKALNLSLDNYAIRPDVKYAGREETERALREVLGYYLHRDLRRGWRVTLPNLEQCGLLLINYLSLHEFCADDSEWENCHSALVTASTRDREKVCHALLDYMRRELAIRVSYLDPIQQESIRQLSRQRLIPPWAFDEEEGLEQARTVFPRSRGDDRGDLRNIVYLSPRGGFGLYLKRPGTFPQYDDRLITDDVARIIPELCERLTVPGILHQGSEPLKDNDVPGYQLNASAMIWRAGRGERAYHDPIRVPREPGEGLRTNPFFTEFYRSETEDIKLINAHEHTAQVPSDIREVREEQFREATLPIMYCSPTMELGVDIAQLNVVNMRNVPPTPANYAQRSGRAGRSGQPAFVFTYCSSGSPHDQYFFKRPELMVAGSVSTPRIDLSNEDLLKAHVHAIWLQTANLSLGNSLQDVLDVSGDEPTLDILPRVQEVLNNQGIRDRARVVAQSALGEAIVDLVEPGGDSDKWLDDVLIQLPQSFEHSCRRWRGLYRSALNQSKRQQKIILNPSRDPKDRKIARRLRAEAESQLRLLLDVDDSQHSDFYSYRCFASEGFLPGYNFPRLPLSAFLPGQRRVKGNDDFLTRPRFLAISEFGPRSIIYHEGSRFTVNKVILPMGIDEEGLTRRGVRCSDCGYIHPLGDEPGPDLCENCASKLPLPYENLFRMQNVATRRRDRINSDEEERFRLGYEIISGIRFAQRGNKLSALQAELIDNDNVPIALLMYGSAATVWRLNLGWRRRRDKDQLGYVIDVERGFWARNQAVDDDPDDPMSPQTLRVIPYVEDTRNCLLINPLGKYDPATMASLEAALKVAIQAVFQLEDRELATEPLPSASERKLILLYEATEGGAGVLKRLVQDPIALNSVAREALELCHFDPDTFQDCGRAPGAREICDAACYDCLLSYYNQRDHRLLDRKLLPDLLRLWTQAKVKTSPAPLSRDEQVARLIRLCQSELEQRWVRLIDAMGLRLPSDAQVLIQECGVRPDFLYRREGVAIFIDGPPHDSDEMRNKDAADREKLVNAGFLVIRFHHADKWELLFHRYPSVFGQPAESQS